MEEQQDFKKIPNSREVMRKYLDEINEIDKTQLNLKREREILLRERFREQPWYKRPGSILSLLAIIISIFLFVLNFFITQQKKQLTISYTKPNSLVLFTNPVKSKTMLLFENKYLKDMSRSLIAIKNTGNKSIQLDDFKDGPILFVISSVSSAPRSSADSVNVPFLLDFVNKNSAGQKQSDLRISSRNNPATVSYLPTLMNPGDIVELEIYTSSQADFKIQAQGKIVDGDLIFLGETTDSYSQSLPMSNREMIFTGFNNLFGAKWVTIFLSILLTLGAAFITLYNYFDNEPLGDFEEYIVVAIPSLITVVFLVISIMVVLT